MTRRGFARNSVGGIWTGILTAIGGAIFVAVAPRAKDLTADWHKDASVPGEPCVVPADAAIRGDIPDGAQVLFEVRMGKSGSATICESPSGTLTYLGQSSRGAVAITPALSIDGQLFEAVWGHSRFIVDCTNRLVRYEHDDGTSVAPAEGFWADSTCPDSY